MEAKRSFNLLILALLAGGLMVGFVVGRPRPRGHLNGLPAIQNPASRSNVAPAAIPTASFNRTRRPQLARLPAPEPGTSNFAKALAVLQDQRTTLAARRQAAYDLVRLGSAESLDALQTALPALPPLVQSAVAEALGQSSHPRAPALLLSLWAQANEVTARSIATALGKQGSTEGLSELRTALLDPNRPMTTRAAAAAGLGASSEADAFRLLQETFTAAKTTDLAPQLLSAIGLRPFAETRAFFQRVLDAPGTEPALRLAALESLSNLPAQATEFLARYLLDADPDIRSEAAWALSTTEDPGNLGPQILGLLPGEADSAVRLRLYQALSNQEGFNVNEALRLTQSEPDNTTRLAAYQALAGVEESRMTQELRTFMDQSAVPALLQSSLQGNDPSERLQAVMILQKVESPTARQALQTLRQEATDEAVRRALRGVK